jgi:hypothetical protein
MDMPQRRPVGWLVGGQSPADWIDAEGEEAIEFRLKRIHAQNPLVEEVPVEGLQVPYIEDDAVALRNRPVI